MVIAKLAVLAVWMAKSESRTTGKPPVNLVKLAKLAKLVKQKRKLSL